MSSRKYLLHIGGLIAAFALAGCGDKRFEETIIINDGPRIDLGPLIGTGGSDGFVPAPKSIRTMILTKANGGALSGAMGCVANQARVCQGGGFKSLAPQPQLSGPDGRFDIEFGPGRHFFRIVRSRPGEPTIDVLVPIEVGTGNANETIELLVPVVCGPSNDDCVSLENEGGVIATITGVVFDRDGPVPDAVVSLSGGAETGGSFVSSTTNSRGEYSLKLNVGAALRISALQRATMRVSAPGYRPVVQLLDASRQGLRAGLNVRLQALAGGAAAEAARTVFRETFELDSPTRLDWVAEGGFVADNDVTTWQLIDRQSAPIFNTLLAGEDRAVLLAPGDATQGIVPILSGRFSYWYGGAQTGSFIGERLLPPATLDGGTSVAPHSGTLTSPPIDLSGVSPGTPVSISFKSFWEIESVNPNCNGFDILSVWASGDGGQTFERLARLNPLSDPQSPGVDRRPLPFTTGGFNLPPTIISQEPIPLDRFAGRSDVRIRFQFETVDPLYNGFRGWVVDDIVVALEPGTTPPAESLCNGAGLDD